jgi:hypothetical protein
MDLVFISNLLRFSILPTEFKFCYFLTHEPSTLAAFQDSAGWGLRETADFINISSPLQYPASREEYGGT